MQVPVWKTFGENERKVPAPPAPENCARDLSRDRQLSLPLGPVEKLKTKKKVIGPQNCEKQRENRDHAFSRALAYLPRHNFVQGFCLYL